MTFCRFDACNELILRFIMEDLNYIAKLEHAVLNQLEADFDSQDYDAMSEMLQLLIQNDEARNILVGYLGDSALENLNDGETFMRY
jgi:DNA-binding SARP family transcriptional activator